MAAVVVTADNNRIEDCEAYTGWGNFGGSGAGGASEAPFAYQASNACNRKVTDAAGGGIGYTYTSDGGTAFDITTGTNRTLMAKVFVSDWGGLDTTDGVQVAIGSSSSAYYMFIVAGTDAVPAAFADYGAKGGYLIVPIDANLHATYSDGGKSSGSPVLTTINFVGVRGAFASASAKSENVAIDALDFGGGLYLVGGDGATADADYTDFVAHDEGTTSNRYGFASTLLGGAIAAFGQWKVGENAGGAVATGFTDSTSIVYWLAHLAAAGFSGPSFNLGSASTVCVDDATHIGAGNTTDIDDRPDYTVTGTSGTHAFGGQLRNFRNLSLSSASTFDGAQIECADLAQNSAHIQNTVITTTSATTVGWCNDATFGTTSGIHDCEFVQGGAGHAFEIAGTTTITLTNLTGLDTGGGYGADTTNSAALHFTATTGTITVNLTNTPTPTYKSDGVTVSFVASYTFTIKGAPTGVQVTIVNSSTRTELQNSTSTGADITYSHSGGETVDVLFMANDYDPNVSDIYDLTLPSANSEQVVNLLDDRNYVNP